MQENQYQLPPRMPQPGPQEQQPQERESLVSITVSSRIPEFWAEKPRLWFVQLEAVIASQRLGDEQKYNLTIAKLDKRAIEQVSDILLNPPADNKYQALKIRLIEAFEESQNQQLTKLLTETELGDQKPSQLLRNMRELARGKIPDSTLLMMWSGHLPEYVRAVLTVTEATTLDKQAAIADKIMETAPRRIHEVGVSTASEPSLRDQIASLTAEIAELRAGQAPQWRRGRSRTRQRSGSQRRNSTPRTPASPDWLCFYHYRYRDQARQCNQPCAWKNQDKAGN